VDKVGSRSGKGEHRGERLELSTCDREHREGVDLIRHQVNVVLGGKGEQAGESRGRVGLAKGVVWVAYEQSFYGLACGAGFEQSVFVDSNGFD